MNNNKKFINIISRETFKTHRLACFYEKSIFSLTTKIIGFAIFITLILVGCSKSYTGEKYITKNSELYIKFINPNTIEWKWDRQFPPEEMAYTKEEIQIRAVRKVFATEQIVYIEILDDDKLKDSKGNIYLPE